MQDLLRHLSHEEILYLNLNDRNVFKTWSLQVEGRAFGTYSFDSFGSLKFIEF